MGAQITAILADATTVIAGLVAGLADVAGFMVNNPLIAISIGLTLVGLTVGIVRRFMHN